jgi:hypothetical protein
VTATSEAIVSLSLVSGSIPEARTIALLSLIYESDNCHTNNTLQPPRVLYIEHIRTCRYLSSPALGLDVVNPSLPAATIPRIHVCKGRSHGDAITNTPGPLRQKPRTPSLTHPSVNKRCMIASDVSQQPHRRVYLASPCPLSRNPIRCSVRPGIAFP